MMEYRNIEYTVVQGIERRVWKWSASVAGVVIMGEQSTRLAAAAAAETAIDRALAQKKVRLVLHRDDQIDSSRSIASEVARPRGYRAADHPNRARCRERPTTLPAGSLGR
jgi:hypothetical protein